MLSEFKLTRWISLKRIALTSPLPLVQWPKWLSTVRNTWLKIICTPCLRIWNTLNPKPGEPVTITAKTDTTTQKLLDGVYDSRGAILYAEYCQICHRADAKGVPRIFPALDGNSVVYSRDAHSVLQITLSGGRMPDTPHDRMAFTMPEFINLSDCSGRVFHP